MQLHWPTSENTQNLIRDNYGIKLLPAWRRVNVWNQYRSPIPVMVLMHTAVVLLMNIVMAVFIARPPSFKATAKVYKQKK